MSEPTVTAILRTYNVEDYLEETIDALTDQTYDDFEVVTVDDGSTDRTVEILEAVDDERFRIFYEDHRGPYRTFNDAVERSRGRYLAVVDADDPPFPERFERQVEYLEDHPDVGVLGTGGIFRNVETGEDEIRRYASRHEQLVEAIQYGNPMIFPSLMFRRAALEDVGLLDVDRYGPDHHLLIRMAKRWKLANLQEPLVVHRLHPQQYSRLTDEDRLPTMVEHRFLAVRELDSSWRSHLFAYLFSIYARLPRSVRDRLPQGLLRGVMDLFNPNIDRERVS